MQNAAPAEARQLLGATIVDGGIRFAVRSSTAERIWVSIFDADGDRETARLELAPEGEGLFATTMPGLSAGTRYGFRADGPYAPEKGSWFDPDKLLVDPYAVEIDRPYRYDEKLGARRGEGPDTATLMPKAVVTALPAPLVTGPPLYQAGGLIYEVPVRAFSMRHPQVPKDKRGTIRALGHPAVIEHLQKLGVSAVELMPVTATMDERHLPPLGLSNVWGYNPVTFMALDPRLAPNGLADLRETVATLRAAGIGTILDLVFNHTAESDELGPTLSLRGLDNTAYYLHAKDDAGRLVNDTGTGNTVACNNPAVQELILDSLRHFVVHAGVDGFRFDLATVLGRMDDGFRPDAPLLRAMRDDPVLGDRILIAEPWDIGADGYRLGEFPSGFLEWNDKYRDDVRRFWRRDRGMVGALATRLSGSSDIFGGSGETATRTVNFIAAHDGQTLADIVRYERKHNEANGENNRDGHNENFSWNNGAEGDTADLRVAGQRRRDVQAMLSTLFASRGAIMLTAGDEFGRSQRGNNNAYAQDNDITWLDWAGRDAELEDFSFRLAALRKSVPALTETDFLTGGTLADSGLPDIAWLTETGLPLSEADWHDPDRHRLAVVFGRGTDLGGRFAVLINGDRKAMIFALPARGGFTWTAAMDAGDTSGDHFAVPARTVHFAVEQPLDDSRGADA